MAATTSPQRRRLPAFELNASAPKEHVRASRAAAMATNALPTVLGGVVPPLFLANCISAQTAVAAQLTGIVLGCLLGAISTEGSRLRRRTGVIAAFAAAAALVATLAVPSARTGFFGLCNALINTFDDAFAVYVGLVPGAGLGCDSAAFGVCLGVVGAVVGWSVTRLRTGAASLLIAVVGASLALRFGATGGWQAFLGCGLSMGAWVVHCRLSQLPGPMRSASAVAANVGFVAALICAVFFATGYLYTPQASVDRLHDRLDAACVEALFGHDTLPQGDLAQAPSMNDGGAGTGLTVTPQGTVSADILLGGFVGADFQDGRWAQLDHNAYEGEWKGVMGWLGSQGLTGSRQRATYDDLAADANVIAREPQAKLDVDASRANRIYVYAPYTLRSLEGAGIRTDLDGSITATVPGPSSYTVVADDVAPTDVLAATSWLAGDPSAYVEAETVWGAFARANYLDLPASESDAVSEYFYSGDTWNEEESASPATVIARVRTMLEATASYKEDPAAPPATGSFVEWFMGKERSGNSAYFATAATLAFRAQGIPARYVEGYRAEASSVNAAAVSGGSLELGPSAAHAWVEVYLGGIGWTPVEVTPGFYTQNTTANDVVDVSEAYSSGRKDSVYDAGSVAGDLPQDEPQADGQAPSLFHILVDAIAVAAGLCAVAAAVVGQRLARIALRARRVNNEDQSVCVPALYRYLTVVMREARVGFDPRRPLDCASKIDLAFQGFDAEEYRRVVTLHQAYNFGGRDLAPNELRTLRRFTERMHQGLPAPATIIDGLHRAFVRAL